MFFDGALPDLSDGKSCNLVHKDCTFFRIFFPFCFLVVLGRHTCMSEFVVVALVVINLFVVVER
jgi:hypothetical protein